MDQASTCAGRRVDHGGLILDADVVFREVWLEHRTV